MSVTNPVFLHRKYLSRQLTNVTRIAFNQLSNLRIVEARGLLRMSKGPSKSSSRFMQLEFIYATSIHQTKIIIEAYIQSNAPLQTLKLWLPGLPSWGFVSKVKGEIDILPLLTWKIFHIGGCQSELIATCLSLLSPRAQWYCTTINTKNLRRVGQRWVHNPRAITPIESALHNFAILPGCTDALDCMVVSHVFCRSDVLQVLNSVVALVSIFVINLCEFWTWRIRKKSWSHQLMHEHPPLLQTNQTNTKIAVFLPWPSRDAFALKFQPSKWTHPCAATNPFCLGVTNVPPLFAF